MSRFSPITRSLGFALLSAALLTACGSTSGTASPANDAATTQATQAAMITAAPSALPSPSAAPTVQPSPTAEPSAAPTVQPSPSADMTAMDHSQHSAGGAADMNLEIKLFMFKPATLEVKPGTTLVWTNQDAIGHTVTAGAPGSLSGAFDSGFFEQGQSYKFTFNEPGTYTYFCKRHESMVGTIIVKAP
jgi:plastocyanin